MTVRDRKSSIPRMHRFGIIERDRENEARILFHAWVAQHLNGIETDRSNTRTQSAVRSIVLFIVARVRG